MALYTEKALLKMMYKGDKTRLRDTGYTGLYYEDPDRNNERRYIVVGKQMGGQVHTTDPKRQERKLLPKKGWIPEAKKIEAATLHAAIGNLEKTAQLAKVPVDTLRKWQEEDWWMTTQQRVKREAMEEVDAKFSQLITKALDKLEKSIDEGDFIYDFKKGRAVQIPMTGRDLAMVTGINFDKRQLLRGEATKITTTTDPEKHLIELAKKFAELVNKDKRETRGEIVDAEYVNVGQLPGGILQETEDAPVDAAANATAPATTADDALHAAPRRDDDAPGNKV